MENGRLKIPGTLVFDYELRTVSEPRELIILLHGFSQSGAHAMKTFARALPPDAVIFAPNGPYPLPRRPRNDEKGYQVGFSWYFYDPSADFYFIGMEVAIEALKGGIQALGLEALPKRIVGFSQGGYLAPFLARELSGVSQVVGVGARFLEDELLAPGAPPITFRLDGVHGEVDIVVGEEEASASHAALRAAGVRGRFLKIPQVGHEITPQLVDGLALAISAAN